MTKKIMQMLFILLTVAILAACGSDDATDTDNYNDQNATDTADAQPTPPPIVIHQATPQPTPAPQTVQPLELTREHFLADLDHFVDTLEAEFLHFGVVYRRFDVDFRQNAAYLRTILADENFEVDADIFMQLMLDNFFMHPDITYSVAGWHFDGQSQRSGGFEGTSGHVEVSVLEEGRIGLIRINCFELRGIGVLGNATRTVEGFLSDSADFEHIIIDIRGAEGNHVTEPWIQAFILPNLAEEGIWQRNYMFIRNPSGFTSATSLSAWDIAHRLDTLPPELDLDLGLAYVSVPPISIAPLPDTTPFAGQMWLLIDGGVGGVAARFADLASYTGVATLVGQPIGGDMSAPNIFIHDDGVHIGHVVNASITWYLPYTQIPFAFQRFLLADHLGRAVDEYVTQPHVAVPDGVDALEYLLEIIG